MCIRDRIESVLFTPEEIQTRCRELAAEISRDHEGQEVIVVGLLKGAFLVLADVARHLTVPNMVDFIAVSSYGSGKESSGSVKLKKDLSIDPAGKHIIIIEDLIDTGGTLKWIQNFLSTKNPASVKLCCLLAKTERRSESVQLDYLGYDCPDGFVVGYGMDFAEHYRTLPFVGLLKPEAYAHLNKTE
eukprot:TRINITY_DN32920_c0_g2_i2.p1 TRINITY_DN32920_c0_g2~~TRINITY_DN32920_c0_g2_i2.p1  ORF type:complete len:187 (+),score=51.30 TRINITY_DN32920_c0_g2_i2:88-648(+)